MLCLSMTEISFKGSGTKCGLGNADITRTSFFSWDLLVYFIDLRLAFTTSRIHLNTSMMIPSELFSLCQFRQLCNTPSKESFQDCLAIEFRFQSGDYLPICIYDSTFKVPTYKMSFRKSAQTYGINPSKLLVIFLF